MTSAPALDHGLTRLLPDHDETPAADLRWRTAPAEGADPRMRVLVARPLDREPVARIVVAHHRDGIDAFTESVCRTLADTGFLAAAPDLFSRVTDPGLSPAEKKETLRDARIVSDLNRCHALLEEDADGGAGLPTGVVGHCMGGRIALLAAVDTAFCDAAVSFYGGRLFQAWGPGDGPGTRADRTRCPVLVVGGREDTSPSPDDLRRLARHTEHARHPVRVTVAEGAGHAFMNFLRADRFRPAAAQTGYAAAVSFLTAHLARPRATTPSVRQEP
ncbi:dienelactone hydrolase family protein [Streptomyces sp. NPDC057682]|uniref:dienelactone hydrolase family protein n=1 Tax=Streptomyces sp. NPDC057682 TaxID=3346210 RepID=UPI00369E8C26